MEKVNYIFNFFNKFLNFFKYFNKTKTNFFDIDNNFKYTEDFNKK